MKSELTKLSNASKPLPVLLVIRIRQRLFASLAQPVLLAFFHFFHSCPSNYFVNRLLTIDDYISIKRFIYILK